jgi:DNA-binding transcriptional MerR regulator
MKISELSRTSGEPIPTIKYYIREGLLPAGQPTAQNQADYGKEHLERLALIRTLRDELDMGVEKIGEVLRAAENGGRELLRSGLHAAQDARHGKKQPDKARPELGRAWAELVRLEQELGWNIAPNDQASVDAASALASILRALPDANPGAFLPVYADAMKRIADWEIPDDCDPDADPWRSLRFAALGTYLFEPLLLALRRLAHRQRTAELHEARARAETART